MSEVDSTFKPLSKRPKEESLAETQAIIDWLGKNPAKMRGAANTGAFRVLLRIQREVIDRQTGGSDEGARLGGDVS